MRRITEKGFKFTSDFVKRNIDSWAIAQALNKLQHYEDLEEQGKLMDWIPVSKGLPKAETEVFIQTKNGTVTTAMYEDGKTADEDSCFNWTDIDFNYDEETDTNFIPEGWWEYRHFNSDDVYNNVVYEEVVAWMPLPEEYKESEQK